MESSVFRKAALIAAACTTVQAVTWMILSLVGLLTSTEVIEGPEFKKSSDIFPAYLVSCYFSELPALFDVCCEDLVMQDKGMLAISIVYLILSIVWLCFSVLLIQDLQNSRKHVSPLTMSWAGVTLVISFLDMVVAILFGVDYAKMSSRDGCFLSVPGFLMSLAARGYVLWLLNVVISLWLLFAARNVVVSRRSSKASSNVSDNYHNPLDTVTQESRSMVFHGGVERPWAGQDPRATKSMSAWDQPDGGYPANPDPRFSTPLGVGSQRGGLAQRMAQNTPTRNNPLSPPTSYHNPTSPYGQPPRAAPPSQQPSSYPTPDYDSRAAVLPRSVMKKPPPLVLPPPTPNNGAQSWRQQVQQPDNRWQQGSPYGGGGGGGGGAGYGGGGGGGGYGGGGGGGGRGYDNRGYDGGRTGF